jgi:hypothetical protein
MVFVNDRDFRQCIAELLVRQTREAEEKPAKK